MLEFDKIHVVWRKGAGERRHSVGILEKTSEGKNVFKYSADIDKLQAEQGFAPYTEFQDVHKEYNGNVAEIFGQRLMKTDRPDIDTFFEFWEVDKDKANDKFYLLGKTQGLVPTDSFEFLAEYNLSPETHFLSELTGLSKKSLKKGVLEIGDVLKFESEPGNTYDEYAVKVFKGDREVGYIKKYHNRIFHKAGADKLIITVKAIEQNGIIKRVFIKISI